MDKQPTKEKEQISDFWGFIMSLFILAFGILALISPVPPIGISYIIVGIGFTIVGLFSTISLVYKFINNKKSKESKPRN